MKVEFVDPVAQASFDAKGYAILDLLADDEVGHLQGLCRTHIPEVFEGIFTNVQLLGPEPNKVIEENILRVLAPHIDAVLAHYVLQGGTFIVKSARTENTSFTLHQDHNVVDERTFNSLALWVPLVDTDEANGGLCVLPGSHRTRYTVRCPQLPSLTIPFDKEIEPLIEHLEVKAGQCCIFSHRLFHGSPSNTSGVTRPVIHGGLIPRGDRMIYHFVHGEGHMSVVKITDSSFIYTDLRSLVQGVLPPHLSVIEVRDQYPNQLTRDEVVEEVLKWRTVNKGVATAGLRAMLKKVSGLLRGETRRR